MRKRILVTAMVVLDSSLSESEEEDDSKPISNMRIIGCIDNNICIFPYKTLFKLLASTLPPNDWSLPLGFWRPLHY